MTKAGKTASKRPRAAKAEASDLFGGPAVVSLSRKKASAEHARLSAEIERHNIAYHRDDAPLVEDAEYDKLKTRLREIEERFPDLATMFSPTKAVGAAPKRGFAKVRHRVAMLSLENAFTEDDVRRFVVRVRRDLGLRESELLVFTAEPKIDGLSASLRYENGRLAKGATRGDGEEGEDVTSNLSTIADIPHKLHGDAPDVFEVRGEVYMTHSSFAALVASQEAAGEKPPANPRNAAAGSVRQLNADDHRVARPALFRLYLGRDQQAPRRHAMGDDADLQALGAAGQFGNSTLSLDGGDTGLSPRDGGQAAKFGIRHRRRRLQSGQSRAAEAAWLSFELTLLGDRAQIPRRAGRNSLGGHRYPGWPHGKTRAGRAPQARHGWRGARFERHSAQRGRDRAQGRARRRHGRHPARG